MFRKSKARIIVLIMSILIAVLAGTVAIIYYSSYLDVNKQNREMLQLYADSYAKNGMPDKEKSDNFHKNRRFELSTFYSVSFSKDGNAMEINNDSHFNFSDEELIKFAAELLEKDKFYGTTNNIAYLITHEETFTLISMMDTMMLSENFTTLLHYTLLFGGIAILCMLILSVFLANKIIYPLEEVYHKQKQFISDAGHELKTPISTINANAEMLFRDVGENQWLSNIQYENKRMSIIVSQLLDLAKVENAQITMENLQLSRIVLAAILPFEANAFEEDFTLSYSVEEDIQMHGNHEQINELISILIDNAFQHSIKQGRINISLNGSHGLVELSVSNNGQEIPLDQRDKIFERFYRTDKVRNSDSKHYGLGLAIAKAIVVAHEGRISVSCKSGTTSFNVIFPQKLNETRRHSLWKKRL